MKTALSALMVGTALSVSPVTARDDCDSITCKRIASLPALTNDDIDISSAAEIVADSRNGKTLVYTDSENENPGFIDIRNPARPQPPGAVPTFIIKVQTSPALSTWLMLCWPMV
ncbi:MAG: hypothetical protein WBO73_14335 [Gammaproteobacteria bacterium]